MHWISVKEIVLAELVSFITASREEDVAPQFRLADMVKLYSTSTRLNELDSEKERTVNSTRLKEDLCRLIPGLYSPKKTGKDVILTFEADVGDALLKAAEADLQDEILTRSKAAKFIRRRIFERSYHFTGEFLPGCEADAVPQELVALVSMVLEGPIIKSRAARSQPTQKWLCHFLSY